MISSRKKYTITLDEIVRSIQESVDVARTVCTHNHVRMMDRFFDKKNDKLVAKTVVLSHGERDIVMPLITIVPREALCLDEFLIETELAHSGIDVQDDECESERKDFCMSLQKDKKNSMLKLSMKFKAKDYPEALNDLLDQFTNIMKGHSL